MSIQKVKRSAKTAKRTDDRRERDRFDRGPVEPLSYPVDAGRPDTQTRDEKNTAATMLRQYLACQAKVFYMTSLIMQIILLNP